MKSMITIAVVLLIGASWVQAQGRGVRGGGRQGARLQAALRTSSTDAVQRPIRQRLRDPNNCPLLTNQASQPPQRGMRFVPRCMSALGATGARRWTARRVADVDLGRRTGTRPAAND